MEEACRNEIERLHDFFVQWFTSTVGEETFGEACQQVLAPNMIMIPPSGTMLNHSQLIQQLLSGYACHKGKQFSIEIRNLQVIWQEGNVCLVTYEEWQLLDGESTSRRSTALFRSNSNTPCGVEWLHLQETCMPNEGETASPPREPKLKDYSRRKTSTRENNVPGIQTTTPFSSNSKLSNKSN